MKYFKKAGLCKQGLLFLFNCLVVQGSALGVRGLVFKSLRSLKSLSLPIASSNSTPSPYQVRTKSVSSPYQVRTKAVHNKTYNGEGQGKRNVIGA